MKLSKFNKKGITQFQDLLQDMRDGKKISMPLDLLSDSELTESIVGASEFELEVFDNRLDLAESVNSLLEAVNVENEMHDVGLWAWLSAAFLDSTCPADADGVRHPKSDYRHIPSSNWRDFYRHLIRGPVRILRLFKDDPEAAAIVLCQHPQSPGDFVEQLASRQERITNPAIIEAANELYFDLETRKPKRGASPNWRKPGTLRRFGDVLDQLDLTYDLYSMPSEELLGLLPDEFAAYRTK